ncbi:MFS transporter [Flindersiella endophytica]
MGRRQVGHEILQGLRFAVGRPYIRPTALMAAIGNFFALVTGTLFLVYAVRDLELDPGVICMILSGVGVGCLIGASLSTMAVRRWPFGAVFVGSRLVRRVGAFLLPIAAGPTAVVVGVSAASFFVVQIGPATSNVLTASLRQASSWHNGRGGGDFAAGDCTSVAATCVVG